MDFPFGKSTRKFEMNVSTLPEFVNRAKALARPQFFVQVGVQGGGIWIIRLGGR
jgi:hypothetical protein